MSDPVLSCAIAYAAFLWFTDMHGDATAYAKDFDSSMYVSETAGDVADALRTCEGREREVALLAKIGRAAADQAHALEDRAQRNGTPLRY